MELSFSDGIAILEFIYKITSWFYRLIKDLNYRRKGISFYIDDYTKTVTIYQNGHGIITNRFKIKVLDWQKFNMQGMERYFDINESSKRNTCLPEFQAMMSEKKRNRFTSYGFWYQSTADIIQFDKVLKDEPTYKGWTFKVDPTCIDLIKKDTIYLSYSISVPGLFPIKDGYYDSEEARLDSPFRSELCIKNQINKMTYVVLFDKEIKVKNHNVSAEIIIPKVNDQYDILYPKLKYNDDMFFYRYAFTKRFPKFQSDFKIEWDILKNGESVDGTKGKKLAAV